MSKTFDSVNHEHLMTKLTQGFVLGPNLFLIYVNDLSQHISDWLVIIQYADDTQFVHTGNVKKYSRSYLKGRGNTNQSKTIL